MLRFDVRIIILILKASQIIVKGKGRGNAYQWNDKPMRLSLMLFRHVMSLEIIVISLIILFLFSVTAHKFQENLLRCMLQIENTFFELGESCDQDCLIICDRGAMDAAACNTTIIHIIL